MVNLSNTPSKQWSKKQLTAVRALNGHNIVVDVVFPIIDPTDSKYTVFKQASELAEKLIRCYSPRHKNFHIKGGCPTFTFHLVNRLKVEGKNVFTAITKTKNKSGGNDTLIFIKFRAY